MILVNRTVVSLSIPQPIQETMLRVQIRNRGTVNKHSCLSTA
jgi:hypothetical protein